jgi:hypothetical protein
VGSTMFSRVEKRLRMIFNPDEPFGGISIITFGDFNQLPPVGDQFIFKRDLANPYAPLQYSDTTILWDHFRYFELTEIMRQRDDLKVAEALTVIGEIGLIGLSDEQIKLFDSRIIASVDDAPQEAIVLYSTNEMVDQYNVRKIRKMPGELFEQKAEHITNGNESDKRIAQSAQTFITKLPKNQTENLPALILLKLNVKYMIINNVDLYDGLVNGTCGTLKKFELDSSGKYATRLWFDYYDPEIGRMVRSKEMKCAEIDKGWTPMTRAEATIKISKAAPWSITRKQFQITECEALTIHKSQGQTYQAVALNIIQKNLNRASLYVALSRITALKDLYLFGAKSIVEGQKFLTYSKSQKKKEIERIKKSEIHVEKKRLKEKVPLINYFPFLDEIQNTQNNLNNQNTLKVMFHNVASLSYHMDYIRSDFAVKLADLLIFVECHTNPKDRDRYGIAGYELVHLSGATTQNASNGIACYIRSEYKKNIKVRHNADTDNLYHDTKQVEMCVVQFNITSKKVYVVGLYNHPENTFKRFYESFKSNMRKFFPDIDKGNKTDNIFVIGDFNIDAMKKEHEKNKIIDKFDFTFLNPGGFTTNRNTTIDWGLTNSNSIEHQMFSYESVFSDHKPLWLYIKKTN